MPTRKKQFNYTTNIGKWCNKCNLFKLSDQFGRRGKDSLWLRSHCRDCEKKYATSYWKINPERMRWHNRRTGMIRSVGITPDEFDLINALQGGICGICGGINQSGKRLFVDHCHKTKKIRGLLCSNCNTGLGLFKDCTLNLLMAQEYLRNNGSHVPADIKRTIRTYTYSQETGYRQKKDK